MIARLSVWFRRIRRWFSRSEWAIRWLHLPQSIESSAAPGLLLVQIDGLSRRQLERALHAGRMPFLRRLLQRERYRLHTMYSGLPSSTPAVQGELFYGQKCAVPAFGFRDPESDEIVRMYDPPAAKRVEEDLARRGEPLLKDGSAYCDIYAGGAAEPHYCASAVGLGELLLAARPTRLAAVLVCHAWSLVRVFVLSMIELGLAVVDLIRGIIIGRKLLHELKFVAARVTVCIALRELVTIGATLDLTRGLPIVHVNYLGYDEQAHRRGPNSAFAHWTLKGIDRAVQRLWSAARRSDGRDYDIWIYSDHGQEPTRAYEAEAGRSLSAICREILTPEQQHTYRDEKPETGIQSRRAIWLRSSRRERDPTTGTNDSPATKTPSVQIAALGPIAHIYMTNPPPRERIVDVARRLVRAARIPLALTANDSGTATAVTDSGQFTLPDEASHVLGPDHPFLWEAGRDLVALCHHPEAGVLVLCGWRPEGQSLSFAVENGAHAGPGREETSAFVLLPSDAPIDRTSAPFLRPQQLRNGVLAFLGHAPASDAASSAKPQTPGGAPIHGRSRRPRARVMTYNVHACLGMDGKLSPRRIARVIRQCDVDVVALQELDVYRRRTSGIDQAHAIASQLDMMYYFHPSWHLDEECYGNAVLSRLPLRVIHAAILPTAPNHPHSEPRAAIWSAVELGTRSVQLINTHLGLRRGERRVQIASLLGSQWLTHPDCRQPVVFCGDFNTAPGSPGYREVVCQLQDAQRQLNGHRALPTWPGRRPTRRIDHIFVSQGIRVRQVETPRSELTRVASDHLPLVVEFEVD